jgi:hypothetical protein
LEEQIDGSRAATTQTKQLTDQAHFDFGSARVARRSRPLERKTKLAKPRRHDLSILEEQIDGRTAAVTQAKELTEQARFDLGSAGVARRSSRL